MELNHPYLLAISSSVAAQPVGAGLLKPLPTNVHVVDFYMVDAKTAVFRIRHLYGKDELAPFSDPVSLNLDEYLTQKITNLEETQLTTVQSPEFVQNRLKWNVDGEAEKHDDHRRWQRSANAFQIDLNPMQIRTYFVTFE
jgi:hypothetical protein